MFWKFRPSALHSTTKYANLSYMKLIAYFANDNKRAQEEGVAVLPRSPNAEIRTLQWNVHEWATASGDSSPRVIAGFIQTILNADADVIVLNEYSLWDRPEAVEEELRRNGYIYVLCATLPFPTAVATRLHVFEFQEVILSAERSAIVLRVGKSSACPASEQWWVVGTHLEFHNGRQRTREMKALLEDLERRISPRDRVILMGDLNQQRQEDYTDSEWESIIESMEKRGVVRDDGVSDLLSQKKFECAWTHLTYPDCNWETPNPPSTHWTGSIVDYSYGRNVKALKVSVSPAGWSDHRMTVCDWSLSNQDTATCPAR